MGAVVQLPGAAALPVAQPVRKGRLPREISVLAAVRIKKSPDIGQIDVLIEHANQRIAVWTGQIRDLTRERVALTRSMTPGRMAVAENTRAA